MTKTADEADIVMNTSTSNPLYELWLSAIGTIESQGSLAWIGMRPPRISVVIGESASITSPGKIPASRQSAARMNMAESEYRSTSSAASAASLRGRPRNVTPNALTKHAAAKAAARASSAPTAGTMIFSAHCGSWGLCNTAWKISHSETKPLNGGSAEIATQPTRNTKLVSGIRWMRPPNLSMSRSPVEVRTAPAPKNSKLLKNEWLST